MKSRFDFNGEIYPSNNRLKMSGYAMSRFGGKRKKRTVVEMNDLPFPLLVKKRHKKSLIN